MCVLGGWGLGEGGGGLREVNSFVPCLFDLWYDVRGIVYFVFSLSFIHSIHLHIP